MLLHQKFALFIIILIIMYGKKKDEMGMVYNDKSIFGCFFMHNVIMLDTEKILLSCNENASVSDHIIWSCKYICQCGAVTSLLFKTSLTILCNSKKILAIWLSCYCHSESAKSPLATLLFPMVTIKWKMSNYYIISDYSFTQLLNSIYVPFSFWYDWEMQEEENSNVYTL